jgi:hypothetical protein
MASALTKFFDATLDHLRRDLNGRSRIMTDYYPHTVLTGVLSFVFVRKLCERLERENKLPAGETGRIWADVLTEFESKSGQDLERGCIAAIKALSLAEP